MTALSGIPIAIYLFLLGLTQGGWATISGKVLSVIAIVAAVCIIVDLLYAHRTLFVRRGAATTTTL
jgi:hypothetical protein